MPARPPAPCKSKMAQPKMTTHAEMVPLSTLLRTVTAGSACCRPVGPSRRLPEGVTRDKAAKVRLEFL
jgi:hypothetical protein